MSRIADQIDHALRTAMIVCAAVMCLLVLHEAYHSLEIRWVMPPATAR